MKYIFTLLILGQIIMAATLQHIEIDKQKIPVIFQEDRSLPLVSIQLTFTNSGGIAGDKNGLAKFSAKTLNEGTKQLGSSAFAELLASKAIHISASTGTETFVISLSSLKEELPEALKQLNNLISNPNLTKETIQKVKTMSIGSITSKENDFDYVASNLLKSILFNGTKLANPSNGTLESVRSIELNDVKKWIKNHLAKSNLIVSVGGDVDMHDVKSGLKKIISNLSDIKVPKVPYFATTKIQQEKILKRDTQQAYIYFGSPYNMKVGDKDYYKSKVASYILGAGGFGSRLMEEIRVKKGLAYSAYSRVTVAKSRSYFSGYLQTKLETLEEAQKSVKSVIEKFVKDGVSADELAQTKKFILGSEPLRVETMSQRLHRSFMEYYHGYKFGHHEIELQKIKDLKLKDLNDFIKKHHEINDLSYGIVTK